MLSIVMHANRDLLHCPFPYTCSTIFAGRLRTGQLHNVPSLPTLLSFFLPSFFFFFIVQGVGVLLDVGELLRDGLVRAHHEVCHEDHEAAQVRDGVLQQLAG